MVEMLDIVNFKDEIIGTADRDEVHEKGYICRMVYIIFYTPDRKLILQRRSSTKKSNPGRLTATVSGHVESGMTYDEAALKEANEETGIMPDLTRMRRLDILYKEYTEGSYVSNAMRALYIYEFDGNLNDLKIEDGEGAGFEAIRFDELLTQSRSTPEKFVPFLIDSLPALNR